MRTFGNIDMQQNELQQAVIGLDTNFPEFPKVGRLCFKDKVLYICADIQDGVPAWIPLTNEIGTYIHYQNFQSSVWNVAHNLGTALPVVQVYEADQRMVIPNDIQIVSNNAVRISFGKAVSGRAVVMTGPDTGLSRESKSFEHFQTELSDTWVINHSLGFYPMVRIFIGSSEVLPAAIDHTDVFTTIVRFSEPQVGVARLV
jgi:hypothetical protein